MTPYEKLALKHMPYTCPTLDALGRDLIDSLPDKYENDILDFIENIKDQITCPMRTALETVCKELIEAKTEVEDVAYYQSVNHE